MSFLYPLLLAGISAIALPILAHMIRHRTRKRVAFSSLMFVPTTLPRFTSRSRVEHWLLLILRCLVICLVAAAFARPFFAAPVEEPPRTAGRRIVLLLDTSASMRRSGLWEQAVAEARKALKETGPADRVCVMRFDRDVATVVGFEAWAGGMHGQDARAAMEAIEALRPGWGATDLGRALVAACEAIGADDVGGVWTMDEKRGLDARDTQGRDALATGRQDALGRGGQVVLISDLQQGSDLASLAGYEWPAEVSLAVRAVRCEDGTNASVQWISGAQGPDAAGDEPVAVRVSNAADSTAEQFVLRWVEGDRIGDANDAVDVYVAPGYSTVVHVGKDDGRWTTDDGREMNDERSPLRPSSLVPRPSDPTVGPMPLTHGGRVVLSGDAHEFDNTLYVAPRGRGRLSLLYVGDDDPNDPAGMLFYLRRAFAGGPAVRPVVAWRRADEALGMTLEQADMVIAAGAMTTENATAVRRYLESGGTALWVACGGQTPGERGTTDERRETSFTAEDAETISVSEQGPRTTALGLGGSDTQYAIRNTNDESATLGRLAGVENLRLREAAVDGYAMLGRLDFRHPLLAAFGEPRFGDFSRIHFWRYRKVDVDKLPGARVLAWFDGGDAAWMEIAVGRGVLFVWMCGWGRADSDLALSSKFVPLLYCCLEHGGTSVAMQRQYFVGDRVSLTDGRWTRDEGPRTDTGRMPVLRVRRPDGVEVALGAGRTTFAGTDLPGIYVVEYSPEPGLDDRRWTTNDGRQLRPSSIVSHPSDTTAGEMSEDTGGMFVPRGVFAVNVAAAESRTAVMAIEELETMGVRFGADRPEPTAKMKERQQRASLAATEQRQKLWRWLLAAAMGVLLAETILAGRLTGRPQNLQEAYHD
ncbi:MAG TPA: VWA domain-containing protein [Phycisphaerales bacterium]|nr:VWA domain-containing protein [Phycisphaerales bacterium]